MLDDLKYIHQRDKNDALGVAEKQWQQLLHKFDIPKVSGAIDNIVHSGMGGSALWAIIATSWPRFKKPFVVNKDYDIPEFVNKKTLFIASSYSGNTEETLASLGKAEAKGAQIVIITSGGKLEEIAKQKNIPLILLPKIDKPRYGAFYGLKALVQLTESLDLTVDKNPSQQLEDVAKFIKQSIKEWIPTVPQKSNPAKQFALEMIGKSIVIYGGGLLFPAAHKWKISFNESSKNIAWEYSFPEFNHNEFTGWTSHPIQKPYAVVYLQSDFDHPRVKQRFELSNKLLSGKWPNPQIVQASGDTPIKQLLWTVAFGDFISLYTALLNGVSPTDIGDKDIIERFKKELGKYEQ